MNFRNVIGLGFGLFLLFDGTASLAQCQPSVVPEKELMITDLSVVNDARATAPGGVWTFGHLIRRLTPASVDPADFARAWLSEWLGPQNVNGFVVQPRSAMAQVLNEWPKNSNGKLDLDRAPFRLLAIVNRVDLSTGPSGEGRLIFGLISPSGQARPMTVIFEYLLPSMSAHSRDARKWAARWHALGGLAFGEAYNQKLAEITESFVGTAVRSQGRRGVRSTVSPISQVRTNEIAFQSPWEMREFTIDIRGLLVSSVTKQTPDESFNSQGSSAEALRQWIRNNADAINQGVHVVPFRSLGGAGHSPVTWASPLGFDPDPKIRLARKNFALQTCTGCHSNETATAFTHVAPREERKASVLSAFLKGDLRARARHMRDLLCGSDARSPMLTSQVSRVH